MGLKGITMNTAPEAEPHIYAEDDAAIYESIVGADGVFSIGQKCKATVLSNNQVRVADGVLCIGGHFARIPYGDYVDVSIANGQSGYKRNDIIIGKIVSTGSGGIDTMTCEVKQGAAAATASDPALTQDNLYAGGKIREIPLYRVRIEGLSIVAVEQLFTVIPTIPQVQEQLAQLNSNRMKVISNGVVNGGKAKVFRRGNTVTLVFNNATTTSAVTGWGTTICQLDSEYAPKGYDFYFKGTDDKSFYMDANGKVVCTSNVASGVGLFATVTYIIM